MLNAARFGTRDIKRAIKFYDAIAELLGASRAIERHGMVGYRGPDGGLFIIGTPREGQANVGNGSQVMFGAPSRAAVDAAHAKALELGGTCEGAPGPRGDPANNVYAASFPDLAGNKIMVASFGPA